MCDKLMIKMNKSPTFNKISYPFQAPYPKNKAVNFHLAISCLIDDHVNSLFIDWSHMIRN